MRNLLFIALLVVATTASAAGSQLVNDPPISSPGFAATVTEASQSSITPIADTLATRFATFLMFEGDAGDAIELYTSVFPEAELVRMELYGPENPEHEDMVLGAELRLGDQRLMFFDSPAPHNFSFTPSVSIFVDFTSEDELRNAYEQLGEGGEVAMPLHNYEFSTLYGWITDRFGVSWQLNLP